MNPETRQVPIILRVIAGLAIFIAFFVVISKNVDPDLYWHLRDGQQILATHSVPRVDQYSYTMGGFPWVDHEWLVETGLWFMWENNLWLAVIFIFSLIAFIPFLSWLKRYRSWSDLWCVVLLAAAISPFIGVRPQLLSYLFFFLVFELLFLYYRQEKASRKKIYIAVMPAIFFVWANIHAEFFSGIALFGLFIAVDAGVDIFARRTIDWREFFGGASLLVMSAAAAVLNPYGLGLYREVFTVMFSANTAKYITEWQPVFASTPNLTTATLIGLFILLAFKFRKECPKHVLVASILFFFLFLKSDRIGPLFIMTAMPIFHTGMDEVEKEVRKAWEMSSGSRVKRRTIIVGSSAAFILMFGLLFYYAANMYRFPFPEKALGFLKQEEASGYHVVVLNDYGYGGYLTFYAPEIKDFIDGRMPHWIAPDGNSAMNDYVEAFLTGDKPNGWQEVVRKWNINTVFIQNGGPETVDGSLKLKLLANGWTVPYEDSSSIILQTSTTK